MTNEKGVEPGAQFRGAAISPGCVVTRGLLNELARISEAELDDPVDALSRAVSAVVDAVYLLEQRLIADRSGD